jgi:localization factor PodJL
MRTDLPWNVAGIPPEAREAARAAARREGLSVGEWLTRQISRNAADAGGAYEPARMTWPGEAQAQRFAEEPAMATNFRESQDMLARVSRSESETHNAYRKIEDHLRSLARRLDTTERAQSDNSHILAQAASEISHASNEQMQAFDTLGNHVIALGERIDRLEQKTSTDTTKDVVRGLQDGLSRMADQVAETAHQSASQISVLASAMEAVVTKMSEAHKEAAAAASALGHRIGLVDDRVHAMETALRVKGDATDRALQRLEERSAPDYDISEQLLAGVEERHAAIRDEFKQNLQALDIRYGVRREELNRAIEEARAVQQNAHNEVHARIEALERSFAAGTDSAEQERAIERLQHALDDARAAQDAAINEVHAHIAGIERQFAAAREETPRDDGVSEHLQRLEDGVERLAARVTAQESHDAGALARLEEGFARIESQQDASLNPRIHGVERSIQELMDRLEAAERSAQTISASLEEQLRALSGKIEGFDRTTRDALSELHQSVKDTSGRLEVIEGVPPSPSLETDGHEIRPNEADTEEPAQFPAEDEKPLASETPQFDMPPFDEPVAAAFKDSPIHRAFGQRTHEAFASPDEEDDDIFREERPLAADALGSHPRDDDFLSATRRSAAAIAMTDEPMATTLGGFTWGARREEAEAREGEPRSRALLIGAIALVAIMAIGAGVMLSQRLGGSHRVLQAAPATAPIPSKSIEAPKPAAAAEPKSDATAVSPKTEAPPQPTPAKPHAPEKAAARGDRLTTLANGGNAKAQLLLGLKYLDGDGTTVNEAAAAKWLQRAADQGEPVAQYRLGTLYERGQGVATNRIKATHWYEAAARQGNRKAMHNLAVAYAEGTGTAKNYNEAARWFARAAALGLADSQFNLAVLYERGLGVPQSLTEAYKWYAIAATQGDNESKARVAALATQLSPADHDAAQKAANAFRPAPLNRAANVPPETPGHG